MITMFFLCYVLSTNLSRHNDAPTYRRVFLRRFRNSRISEFGNGRFIIHILVRRYDNYVSETYTFQRIPASRCFRFSNVYTRNPFSVRVPVESNPNRIHINTLSRIKNINYKSVFSVHINPTSARRIVALVAKAVGPTLARGFVCGRKTFAHARISIWIHRVKAGNRGQHSSESLVGLNYYCFLF